MVSTTFKVTLVLVIASASGQRCDRLFVEDAADIIHVGFAALDGDRSRHDFTLFSVALPPKEDLLACRVQAGLNILYRREEGGKWNGRALHRKILRQGGNVTLEVEPCSTYRIRLRTWLRGKGTVTLNIGNFPSGPADLDGLEVAHAVDGAGEANELKLSWPHLYKCVESYSATSNGHEVEVPVVAEADRQSVSFTVPPCVKARVAVAAIFDGQRGVPIEASMNTPPQTLNVSLQAHGTNLLWNLSSLVQCQHVLLVREVVTARFSDDDRQVDEVVEVMAREVPYFSFGESSMTADEAGNALRRHGALVAPCQRYSFALNLTVVMEGDATSEGPRREFASGQMKAVSDEHHHLHFGTSELTEDCIRRVQEEEEARRAREGKALEDNATEAPATADTPDEEAEGDIDEEVYYDEAPSEASKDPGESGGKDYEYTYDDEEEETHAEQTLTQVREKHVEGSSSSPSMGFVISIMVPLIVLLALAVLVAFAVLARRRENAPRRGEESAAKEFEHRIPLAEEDGGLENNAPIIKGQTSVNPQRAPSVTRV